MKKIYMIILVVALSACTPTEVAGGNNIMDNVISSDKTAIDNQNMDTEDVGAEVQPELPEYHPVEMLEPKNENELIRFRGDAPWQSETFFLSQETTLQIFWEQAGLDEFEMLITRVSDPATEDGELQFLSKNIVFSDAQSNGQKGVTVPSGEYYLEILVAGGDWEVWVDTSLIAYENLAGEGELVRISGDAPGISDSFFLEEPANILISWDHEGVEEIDIVLEWIDAPSANFQYFDLFMINTGQTGSFPHALLSGEYRIIIETSVAPWEIWIAIN